MSSLSASDAIEMNFDGLVGPTHNYSGLSFGNIASDAFGGSASNPKAAALQGLQKMRAMLDMGLEQGLLPPHERPYLPLLRRLGFSGSDAKIVESVAKSDSALLANLSSASAMWTANAATVCPSADSMDGKVHITPANLLAMPHRAIEADQTKRSLKTIFKGDAFEVHEPLVGNTLFGDEGAANHNRLARSHGNKGLQIFVYGRHGADKGEGTRFPGRQTKLAFEAIARSHKLPKEQSFFLQQSNRAIDAGAFHNDVVCVTNGEVMFYHEWAFDDGEGMENAIAKAASPLDIAPVFVRVADRDVPVSDAIKSYLFNSQIVTRADGQMCLILPQDVHETDTTRRMVERIIQDDNPISEAKFFDLKESMKNGGGPACLRLRVVLTGDELKLIHQPIRMTNHRLDQLEIWVKRHYRDRLEAQDLADPELVKESQAALDELTKLLHLGSLYPFQRL